MAATVAKLRREAAGCERCPLWKLGTHTVFGEGAERNLMLVGEQPGDVEDRAGRPFVGPAGRLLRELLEEAEIAEEDVYLTNAVKHFKWRPKGKRRIQDKPSWSEIRACSHWLDLETRSGSARTRRLPRSDGDPGAHGPDRAGRTTPRQTDRARKRRTGPCHDSPVGRAARGGRAGSTTSRAPGGSRARSPSARETGSVIAERSGRSATTG